MTDPIRRTDTVKIKLAPDMIVRLDEQARSYGMPPATLCAFAVADWLKRQENAEKLTRMAVLDATRSSMPSDEQISAAIAKAVPEVIKHMNPD